MLKAKMLVPKDKYVSSSMLENFETKEDLLSTDPIELVGFEIMFTDNSTITFFRKQKLQSCFDSYKFNWHKMGEYTKSPNITFYTKDKELICTIKDDNYHIFYAPDITVGTLNRIDTSYNSKTNKYKEEHYETIFDDSHIEAVIYRYN